MAARAVDAQTASQAPAQALDRVVAAVGNVAITASDVESEYRLELLLDGTTPGETGPDAATLKGVRQRMIDRQLLEEEGRADGIKVSPQDPAVTVRLSDLEKKFATPERFSAALKQTGMDEQALRVALAAQEEVLRLIDERLRPQAIVEPAEIEGYYHNTLLPELARQGKESPPLGDVEGRIREILVQRKIDSLLDDWLKRLRVRGDVRVFGSAEVNATQ